MSGPSLGHEYTLLQCIQPEGRHRRRGGFHLTDFMKQSSASQQCTGALRQQRLGDVASECFRFIAYAFALGADKLAANSITDQAAQVQTSFGLDAKRSDRYLTTTLQMPCQ